MLGGLTSIREAYGSPEGLERIRRLRVVGAGGGPAGRGGPGDVAFPARTAPCRSASTSRPAGSDDAAVPDLGPRRRFPGGDLDMREADWTAREVCARADAVVVSVDYRLAVDGVSYPVPHDDTVAAVRWVRDNAADLGIDGAHLDRRRERGCQPDRGRGP